MGGRFDLFFFIFLSSVLIIIQNYGLRSTAQSLPIYVSHFCYGGHYTANSTFQANLNRLLPSLSSSNNNTVRNGYLNATAGQNPPGDIVYGSFQCRGDVTSETCQDCVDRAAQDIIQSYRCPNSKEAIIWYEECMLRYSNQSFFTIMEVSPAVSFSNNVTKPEQFNQLLAMLITEAVSPDRSSSPSNIGFATGELTLNSQTRYGLVQCTSDLSNDSCNTCLRRALDETPKGGGRVIQPSCYFRYEMYPFYGSQVTAPLPPSPNTTITNTTGKNSSKIVIIIVVLSVMTVLCTIIIWYFCLQRRKTTKQLDDVDEIQSAESLQFNFSTISAATDNFSDANKLGQGGFGSVYKGTLSDGQEIAVKRLSKNSGQGEEEFKNEVVLVVKLQHRNLVRLLGFCLHGEERLLIYEFMPNASLDQFLFDPIKHTYLDWERRYNIIGGIARGLLYLHEDSRLKIIHRDLKASNILLDADMNPKISDFGMARMFMVNQTQASTNRIVGTYGYMAPEYAMHGQFSVKSDVFSFGVLMLEILSGRKNTSFYGTEGAQNLLSYTWQHWKEGTAIELLDPTLKERYSRIELMRCIHIGLLCVQEDLADRPTMASIVNKLNNYVSLKPPSSPPTFFVHSREDYTMPSREIENFTMNEVSITELYPR